MTDQIRTAFTDLVGVRYPVVQAAMSWVSSCWELPVAVSEAGGLGVLASGPMRLGDVKRALDDIREWTSKPWAVNLPLYRRGAEEVQQLLLSSPPPVLIASQGSPKKYLRAFQDAGTRCFHVVASTTHAHKAAEAGVDGLVVVGGEAGGHPPASMVSSLVLTRFIARELPEVPVIASGGFADGAGLAAGLALGASAVQFGTRFLASEQARVHPAYQQMILDAGVEDTRTVGKDLGVIRSISNDFTAEMEALEEGNASIKTRRETFHSVVLREAAVDGLVHRGKVEAGQSAGLIDAIEDAGEIVRRIVREYRATIKGMPGA